MGRTDLAAKAENAAESPFLVRGTEFNCTFGVVSNTTNSVRAGLLSSCVLNRRGARPARPAQSASPLADFPDAWVARCSRLQLGERNHALRHHSGCFVLARGLLSLSGGNPA